MDLVKPNYINHVTIVADASGSMRNLSAEVVTVMDAQVASLAEQSRHHDQETRISLYTFSSPGYRYLDCLIWDKDVLRMPSIAGLYHADGGTALCDALVQVMSDLRLIPEKHGDHSHLLSLLTDGMENRSKAENIRVLPQMIASLPGNWTIAGFVPSATAKHYLQRYGFPPGNISIWNPEEEGAVEEVGHAMAAASGLYMASRAQGMRSTTNLFQMSAPSVTELKKTLTPLTPGSYFFEQVSADEYPQGVRIDEFVTAKTGKPYNPGTVLYMMMKRERIQEYKKVAVQAGGDVFMGSQARAKLGLPEHGEVRVSPGKWKGYAVFIESRSFNRKLLGGTRVLIIR